MNAPLPDEDVPRCKKCGVRTGAPHTCPFRVEINDDSETLCTCCDDCRQECCDDI